MQIIYKYLFRRGILKRARSLPPEEFLLPQKLVDQLRRGEGKHGKAIDSGFNSEQNRFFLVFRYLFSSAMQKVVISPLSCAFWANC